MYGCNLFLRTKTEKRRLATGGVHIRGRPCITVGFASQERQLLSAAVAALPGMTANSLLPQGAKAAGIEFPELLERICNGAIKIR
jgi:hypothetical protein